MSSLARRAIVALAVFAMLAAACSSSGDDGGGDETGGDQTGGGEAPGAADGGNTTGVTDDTIKIAALVGDNDALADLGFAIDIGDTQKQYEFFLDEIESHGRTVDISIQGFNSIDEETQRAACLGATQDDEAFATVILGGLQPANVLCVTQENETPMIQTSAQQRSIFDDSQGRFLSANNLDFDAILATAATVLDELGELDGKTIGVVATDNGVDEEAVADALEPTLADLGHEIAEQVVLPCDGALCDQYDVAVQKMADAGVDAVFSTPSAVSMPNFVAAGAEIGFTPEYFATAIGNQDVDVLAQRQEANADAYEGTLAVTQASRNWTLDGAEPAAFGDDCNDRYAEGTGEPRAEWGSTEDAGYGAVFSICSMANLIQLALDEVGEDLTQERFLEAMNRLTGFPINAAVPEGSFGPDKQFAADNVNVLQWSAGCNCFEATDGQTYPITVP